MPLHSKVNEDVDLDLNPMCVRQASHEVPRFRIAPVGMLPDTALQVVSDELILDGNARLNLATFVTTWMEPQAEQLMAECFDKNMIDKDEYPQTAELERRCVSMLGDLWHAPDRVTAPSAAPPRAPARPACSAAGAASGAGEPRRRARRAAATKPNMIMGANVQVCWEKFCRYWEVEPRYVPMDGDRLHLGAEEAAALCDENTIGVVVVLGSTLDGRTSRSPRSTTRWTRWRPRRARTCRSTSTGRRADSSRRSSSRTCVWDFRLPRVASINTSGHKFGLVYPGVGWIVWRDSGCLPEDLIFRVNYLGGDMPTFALNFSRPGAQVAAQYYNFIRLGFEGYRQVQQASQDVAVYLSARSRRWASSSCSPTGTELPVFAFKVRDGVGLHGVRRVRAAARPRLAGARLHRDGFSARTVRTRRWRKRKAAGSRWCPASVWSSPCRSESTRRKEKERRARKRRSTSRSWRTAKRLALLRK